MRTPSKWSIKDQISILFLTLVACFAAGVYVVLRASVFPAFTDFELKAAEQDRSRVQQLLEAKLETLEVMNIEYSAWDQTYEYAVGRRPQFVEENVDPSYWHSVNIHMMLLLDSGGELLIGTATNPHDSSIIGVEELLGASLMRDHLPGGPGECVSGFVPTPLGVMLVASCPITASDRTGPTAGRLITGEILTDQTIAAMGRRASTISYLYPTNVGDLPPRAMTAVGQAMESAIETDVTVIGEEIYTYEVLRDILGEPAAVLEVVSSREISRIGSSAIRTAGWSLVAATGISLLVALLFMNRTIVRPIGRLTTQIQHIQETGDLSVAFNDYAGNEVGILAREFGVLANRLDAAKKDLEQARDLALNSAKAKSEFLARMSHEIRTPMNGVLGMTELLLDTPLNPRQKRFAGTIYDSAESLLSIINDILDFSKMEAGKLQLEHIDVDLCNLLEETVDSVASSAALKGVELINLARLDIAHTVKTDPGRLRQVLTNLLGNAIKFTDKGEIVMVASKSAETADSLTVNFEVRDTGIGIRPEKQDTIFTSFTQEDGSTTRLYGGTGLGLAISKQLVEMMGGEMSVDSLPGRGSTFSFSLRMKKGKRVARALQSHASGIAEARVLIVDDNATNCEILEHHLARWHAVTEMATSADAAIEKLQSCLAAGDRFDVAILDIHMPGKDGIELAEAVRQIPELEDLRLIALSSVSQSISSANMSRLDIAGQLTKPIRQSNLYDVLVAVLANNIVPRSFPGSALRHTRKLSGTVLLAEDNAVNRMVAAGMLESMGLQVVMANNGAEAVKKTAAESVDIVMMDCQMPQVDGFDATRQIRQAEATSGSAPIPIIALTANALKGDREKCLDAGMDEYLSKPFTAEQLHSTLSAFISTDRAMNTEGEPQTDGGVAGSDDGADKPAIDRGILDELAELQHAGSDDFVGSVVRAYLDSANESNGRMREAIAAGDATRIGEIAHALSSSSANVGATGLARLCKRLEAMGREDNLAGISETHQEFNEELERVVADLKHEIAEVTS